MAGILGNKADFCGFPTRPKKLGNPVSSRLYNGPKGLGGRSTRPGGCGRLQRSELPTAGIFFATAHAGTELRARSGATATPYGWSGRGPGRRVYFYFLDLTIDIFVMFVILKRNGTADTETKPFFKEVNHDHTRAYF